MNRTLLVAYREYLENVRTKGFWIGIAMMPIVLIVATAVPILVETTKDAKRYAVIDHTGHLAQPLQEIIDRDDFRQFVTRYDRNEVGRVPGYLVSMLPELQLLTGDELDAVVEGIFADTPIDVSLSKRLHGFLTQNSADVAHWWRTLAPEVKATLAGGISTRRYIRIDAASIDELNERLNNQELFAYFVLTEDVVDSPRKPTYVSNNLTDTSLLDWYSTVLNRYVRNQRLERSNVGKQTADWINEAVEFEAVKINAKGDEEEVDTTAIARQWIPVAFVWFLWISIQINTQMLITNTIEEKSNKLIEVLLSSVSPIALMAGKIIGIAATGLTVILSWIIMILGFVIGLPVLLGADLPIDLSSLVGDPWLWASFLVYYTFGYLLYAALFVGLGSVCNNLKDAQNLMLPVQMIQIVPIVLMIPIGRDPNGMVAQVLSYVPPLTPYVMMNRAAGPPSATEYVITTVLLALSILAAFWLAAKMFRVGILMTGKAPGFMEILRLIRAPITAWST